MTTISKGREHFAMHFYDSMDAAGRLGLQHWMVLEILDRKSATFRRIASGGVGGFDRHKIEGEQYIDRLMRHGQEVDADLPGELCEAGGKRMFYIV